MLNLMRAVAMLRPGVLVVPRDSEGRPVFRLSDLAAANGLAIRQAHDARRTTSNLPSNSVNACARRHQTFGRASRASQRRPQSSISIAEEPAFGYFDNFGGLRCVRPLTRIAVSPSDQNLHYCLDLTNDVAALRALSDDQLAEIVRGLNSPVRKLKVNGSPFLCPLWELDHDHLAPSDEDQLKSIAQRIQADERFIARLTRAAVSSERVYAPSEHVELQIYGKGWPSDEDLKLCRDFHASSWEQRLEIVMRLSDTRFRRLGRRLESISSVPTCCVLPTETTSMPRCLACPWRRR